MPNQSLSQVQSQKMQQVLAPQMRQSLEFLQAPMLELRALVQQEMEQNPALEEKPLETEPLEVEQGDKDQQEEARELEASEEYEALAQLDDEWRDYFTQNQVHQPYTQDDAEKRQFFMDSLTEKETLHEHLISQLHLSVLDDHDQSIAEILIGNITDDGYLNITLGELSETADVPVEDLERLLEVIQDMHPIGVGARNLEECLLIQMDRLGVENVLIETMISHHLEWVGAKKYELLAKELGETEHTIQEAVHFISTLEPKPGRLFSTETATYVVPEVMVTKLEDKYIILTNNDQIPRLRISKNYRNMLKDPTTPKDVKTYIKEKIQSAMFMIKSIHQRQQTILNISSQIVDIQQEFMEKGVSKLKPLTMSQVAKIVGIHETTVSRAIANKYIQTPQGLYEMKYFFTPGLKTDSGDTISNKSIQDMIEQLIDAESLEKPLSDQAITNQLKEKGINVARRTVAKYREGMGIAPSHERKV